MKVLFLVNNPDFFLSHRLAIALAARKAGYEVHVATPERASAETIRSHGFTFHALPMDRSRASFGGELRTLLRIVRLYRSVRPDIAHHVTIKPVLYGTVAARIARVPAVCNAISGLGFVFLARGPKAFAVRSAVAAAYRLALRHSNQKVIFQNPDDRGTFLAKRFIRPSEAVLIKGSGADTEAFSPQPEPSGIPVVILPARLLRDKGVAEFVAAARELRARGVAARFALVGEADPGNPSSITAADLDAWAAEGVVEAWGFRRDMARVFSECHLVCLPSYREGFSKVLIEAAACGKAIVTTDTPGCRDMVEAGKNGLLVPVRDARALAEALLELIRDPARREAMGRDGRRRVLAEFSEAHVIDQTLDLYRELAHKAGPAAKSAAPAGSAGKVLGQGPALEGAL
jgi:glycosyltransferase involved in cell wall biosynthesis